MPSGTAQASHTHTHTELQNMQMCLACHPSVHPIVGSWGPMGLCLQQIPDPPWLGHVHVSIVLEQHGVIGHVLVTKGLAMHLLVCIIAVNHILHAGHVQLGRSIGAWHKEGAWSKLQARDKGVFCCVHIHGCRVVYNSAILTYID